MSPKFHLCVNSLVLFVLCSLTTIKCESYSTVASLTELVEQNVKIIEGAREYQRRRLVELEKLQKQIDLIQQVHDVAVEDVEDYLSNPINAFKLIKRTVVDWDHIHDIIVDGNITKEFKKAWNIHLEEIKLPQISDLNRAIDMLTNLKNNEDGISSDVLYGPQMTWDECYEIGIRLYDRNEFTSSLSWLQLALDKGADRINDMVKADILEYMAYSHHGLGNVDKASLAMEEVLKIPSVSPTVKDAKEYLLLSAKKNFAEDVILEKVVLGEPHSIHIS